MSEHCNCGHDHEHEECGCEMDNVITLVDDEGIEHEFDIVDTLEDNGSEYVALVPVLEDIDGEAEEAGELVVLKIVAEGVDNISKRSRTKRSSTASPLSLLSVWAKSSTSSKADRILKLKTLHPAVFDTLSAYNPTIINLGTKVSPAD